MFTKCNLCLNAAKVIISMFCLCLFPVKWTITQRSTVAPPSTLPTTKRSLFELINFPYFQRGTMKSPYLIPREARPKASRSGVYNFVPQRAQAGWNLVWSLRSCIFIYLFIYLSVRLVCAGNDVTRPRAGGLRCEAQKNSDLRDWGRGFESCKVFFFFPPFSFLFFLVSNPEPFLEPFLFSVYLFGLK